MGEPGSVRPHTKALSRPALEARLADLEPEEARWTLIDYLDGRASAEVTLPRLILALGLVEEVEACLDQVARSWQPPVPQTLRRLVRMIRERRRGLERVADTLGDHPDPETPFSSMDEGIDAYRRFFDRAVRRDEPSSVAAHSLGDPEVLEKSTQEVIQLFERLGVLGTDRHALEIGCGIGRFLAPLAPRLASVHGTDISPRMIETARRRCVEAPNVSLSVTSGRDLSGFEAASFDLVFAADSFPYIHHAGRALAAHHIREAARVLRSGGDLVVLNYSYREDVNTDRREMTRLCASCGFELLANGEQPLRLWDAYLFHGRRRAA